MAGKTGLPTCMPVESLHKGMKGGEDKLSGKGCGGLRIPLSLLLFSLVLAARSALVTSHIIDNGTGSGDGTSDSIHQGLPRGIEEISRNLTISTYTQIHDGAPYDVKSAALPSIEHLIPRDAFIISSDTLPDARFMTSVGNGHVGTVVDSDTILMNGFYNGRGGHSHRARIPSMVSCIIDGFEPRSDVEPRRTYTLNMMNGMYLETIYGDDFILEKKVYAHRQQTRLLVTEIDVVRMHRENQTALKVLLKNNQGRRSNDIRFDRRSSRRK